jgi:hypothetical protein
LLTATSSQQSHRTPETNVGDTLGRWCAISGYDFIATPPKIILDRVAISG